LSKKRKPTQRKAASLITRGEARLELTDEEIAVENARIVKGLLQHKLLLDQHLSELLILSVSSGAPLVKASFPIPTNVEGAHRVVTLVLGYGQDVASSLDEVMEVLKDDDEDQGSSV
jgi:hypothetical protein